MSEKLPIVGSKGKPTDTPRETSTRKTIRSVTSTSSSGLRQSSTVGRQSSRSDYIGFYASPFPATGSVTRISQRQSTHGPKHSRASSEMTLFPSSKALRQAQEPYSPLDGCPLTLTKQRIMSASGRNCGNTDLFRKILCSLSSMPRRSCFLTPRLRGDCCWQWRRRMQDLCWTSCAH